MQFRKSCVIGLLSVALVPAIAPAQGVAAAPGTQSWFFTPFIGGNFGGDADFGSFNDGEDEIERRLDFGASIGWNPNVVGIEIDLGWSPNFFQETRGRADFQTGDSNLTTVMANLHIAAPPEVQLRPYGSGGLGLIHTRIADAAGFEEVNRDDLGLNLGGGVQGQLTDVVGVRADARYFRSLEDRVLEAAFGVGSTLDFWRGTLGATVRW
jgi:opacity protein-like surface antigen